VLYGLSSVIVTFHTLVCKIISICLLGWYRLFLYWLPQDLVACNTSEFNCDLLLFFWLLAFSNLKDFPSNDLQFHHKPAWLHRINLDQ